MATARKSHSPSPPPPHITLRPRLAPFGAPPAPLLTAQISAPSRNWGRPLLVKSSNAGLTVATRTSVSASLTGVHNGSIPMRDAEREPHPFTYNLCQCMGELGAFFEVYQNDEISVEEIKRKNPRGILVSPGPGTLQESGISLQIVLELGSTIPLFGVCMGLQCIGKAFGGKIVCSPFGVRHGKSSLIYYDEKEADGLFAGLPKNNSVSAHWRFSFVVGG